MMMTATQSPTHAPVLRSRSRDRFDVAVTIDQQWHRLAWAACTLALTASNPPEALVVFSRSLPGVLGDVIADAVEQNDRQQERQDRVREVTECLDARFPRK